MTRPPSCLSELRFTSLLQYSPDGVTKASIESRHHVVLIKRGRPAHIERIRLRGAEYASGSELGAMLGAVPRKGRTLPEWMGILLHELVHVNCLKNHMAECLASYTGDIKKGADVKAHIDKCVADAKRKCGHDVGGEGWQATVVGQSFQRAAEVIGW